MKSKKHPKRVSVNKSATTTKKANPSVHASASQLQSALTLHQQGHLDEAEAIYKEILQSQPNHFDALQLLATINAQKNKFVKAISLFDKALAINPDHAETHNNRGNALSAFNSYEEAIPCYERAIALNLEYAEAYFNQCKALKELNRFEDALMNYKQALALKPDYTEAYINLSNLLLELKRYEDAIVYYDKALTLIPDNQKVYNNRGIALQKLKRCDDALASYNKAVTLKPDYPEAYNNIGNTLQELSRYDEALVSYNKAITLKPDYAEAYSNRGIALQKLNRYDDALASYDKAITLLPNYPEAHFNRGNTLHELKRYNEGIESYDKALVLKPDFAEAHNNRGISFQKLNRFSKALQSYDTAIALVPDYAEAYYNRGNALHELRHYEEAIASFEKAMALKPDTDFLLDMLLHTRMKICYWHDFNTQLHRLATKTELLEKVSAPFPLLALLDSPALHKNAAVTYVNAKYPANNILFAIPKHIRHNKIRIGYYSADFHDHATTRLLAELFELHDKSRFELFAFSFGPDKHDNMRTRVSAAFDRFINAQTMTDIEVVKLSRELEIDIAVDLKGFTTDCRTGIFALRAAPIQVNYLGYPGTMGADYIDYLIADNTLIPINSQQYFTEKIAYLPDSYQVNDTKRRIADKVFTRKESGLPETGFVFCCFNNNHKITPTTFDGWMRILGQVKGSVLWLFEDNPIAASNLKKEAVKRGVNAERLIFAKRMPLQEHLARHRLADLFLDTLPYNAQTTASDALWAGLPVLTCMGESFASRVAASLLNALHLHELITSTQDEYEALAIELATDPEKLAQIKQKLYNNRLTTPLFDTPLFTKHLEEAYTQMYERYHADLPPDHIYINSTH